MGYIYKITNDINNKVYIGQTTKNVHTRFKEHIATAKTHHKNNYTISYFHKAIVKYGEEHFHLKILEECANETLDEREIYWISYYNSYEQGYNMTPGGQNHRFNFGKPILQYNAQGKYIQTFKNTAEAAKAAGVAESTIRSVCQQRAISAGGYRWKDFTLNFPLQIEPIESPTFNNRKPVNQFNLKGQLINRFNSLHEASRFTNIHVSNISRACHLKGKTTAGKFQWRFDGDSDVPSNIEKKSQTSSKKTDRPVKQYDKQHNLIKEWNSIKEAATSLNIRTTLIIYVCEGKQKTTGGYYWRYKKLTSK